MEHQRYPSSILSYINEETQTFHEKPFGFVDGFVYSLCSYFLFENSRAANSTTPLSFNETLGALSHEDLADLFWFNDIAPLFRGALLASPRYAPSAVSHAEAILSPQDYGQFAACCIHVPDGSLFLSFRGTDDTITGWEENFTMSVLETTTGQEQARTYTANILASLSDPETIPSYVHNHANDHVDNHANNYTDNHADMPTVRLGGHSKGGNLAFYATLTERNALRSCLARAYSFDGPGFAQSFLNRFADASITSRMVKITPSYSFFGSFFNDAVVPRVVESNEWGLMEHMPFSWVVEGDDFVWSKQANPLTAITDKTFAHWLDALPLEERITFLSILFGTVEYAATSKRIVDLPKDLFKKAPLITYAYQSLDKSLRKNLTKVLSALGEGLAESTQEVIKEQLRS